eukprot:289847_1
MFKQLPLVERMDSKTQELKEQAIPFINNPDDADDVETEKQTKMKKKNLNAYMGNIISFILLTFQTAAVVLLMRYSRLETHEEGVPSFAITSAVFLAESGKCLVGIIVTLYDIINGNSSIQQNKNKNIFIQLTNEVFNDTNTVLKMSVPAILYMIQNNLLFTALQHLDAAFYQILYQLKMFSAAILATIMIKRQYTKYQWLSFLCLAAGAILANLSIVDESNNNININNNENENERNPMMGIICVLCACCTSGFSGVYMEIQLKGSKQSLYVKNIQLAMFGALSCLINSYVSGDYDTIVEPYGFLHGFTKITYIVVFLNVIGGYMVAYIIKYIENIAKAFAATTGLILIVGGSWYFFDTELTSLFFVGFALVIVGNVLFNHKMLCENN